MEMKKADRSDLRSQALDLLRFPLAGVIVIIHTFSYGGSTGLIFSNNEIDFHNVVFFEEIQRFIDGFLRGQSVPIYFFISGFVFFLSVEWSREKYIQKLKNRVKTLLIPYLIWNTIALLLVIISQIYFTPFLSKPMQAWNFSLKNILLCYWVYKGELLGIEISSLHPINGVRWFVRDLMIVVLCTPLLYRLMKRGNCWFVVSLGVLWFFKECFDERYAFLNGWLSAFFFFSWGAYMSINRKDMLVEFGRYFRLSVFMYSILGLSYVAAAHWCPEICKTIKSLNVFFGLLFAYNLAAWLLRKKYCKASPFLASSSFFIYVSHSLICGRLLKLLYIYLQPASSISLLFIHISTVVLTLAFLLSAFYLMRRYTPALLRVLTGRR